MTRSSRYVWATLKNHTLLHEARMILLTIQGFDASGSRRKVFTHVVYEALRDAYLSNVIKVLEDGKQVASFWYLHRVDARPMKAYLSKTPFDLTKLTDVSRRLKVVRNRAHFHIDRDYTTNDAYAEAGIPWAVLNESVEFVYGFLTHLRTVELECTGLNDHGYSVSDAKVAVAAVELSDTRAAFA